MECTGRCVSVSEPFSPTVVAAKYQKFGDSPEIRQLARDVLRWECRPYPTIQPPPLAYFIKIESTSPTALILFRQSRFFSVVCTKSSALAEMGDSLATIDMVREDGGCCAPVRGGESGPHITQCSLGREVYCISVGILIHPAVWPQQTWTKKWGRVQWPFLGEAWSLCNTIYLLGRGLPAYQVAC